MVPMGCGVIVVVTGEWESWCCVLLSWRKKLLSAFAHALTHPIIVPVCSEMQLRCVCFVLLLSFQIPALVMLKTRADGFIPLRCDQLASGWDLPSETTLLGLCGADGCSIYCVL